MKSFREHISEEVVPAVLVKDGSIDIEQDDVRASVNMALAKVTACPKITPYIALNKISKALAWFSIILPKKVYLDGAKGIEVYEIRQFGDRMGMNDQGEFIHHVPSKYYLFIQYGMYSSATIVGGTYRVMAKVVDKVELDRLVDAAEVMMKEEKEPPFKGGHKRSHEKSSTHVHRLAVKAMERMKDREKEPEEHGVEAERKMARRGEKMYEDRLDEMSPDAIAAYMGRARVQILGGHPKTGERVAGSVLGQKKLNGRAKVNANEETLDELNKGTLRSYRRGAEQELGDIKHFKKRPGQYPAATSDDTKAAERREKTREQGIRKASKILAKEEQIDELYGKGSLGKIKGHHEKEAKRSYNKMDKVSGYEKQDALEKKGDYHYAQSERASGIMSKTKPKSDAADPLSWRTPSKGLVTRGPRKGKPYAGAEERTKIDIKYALGKHKKPNLPEEALDELSKETKDKYWRASFQKAKESETASEHEKYKARHSKSKKESDEHLEKSKKHDDDSRRRSKGQGTCLRSLKEGGWRAKVGASLPKHPYMEETIAEKAPPGAKYERMVKHIKKGYAKNGLTNKEKAIAYATAWKSKNKDK